MASLLFYLQGSALHPQGSQTLDPLVKAELLQRSPGLHLPLAAAAAAAGIAIAAAAEGTSAVA